jgi:hypothetical protein
VRWTRLRPASRIVSTCYPTPTSTSRIPSLAVLSRQSSSPHDSALLPIPSYTFSYLPLPHPCPARQPLDHARSSLARSLPQHTILAHLTRPLACSRTESQPLALTLAAARHRGNALAGTGGMNAVGSAAHESRLSPPAESGLLFALDAVKARVGGDPLLSLLHRCKGDILCK